MRLAIERLQRERSLTNRELAADILPLVEAFRHKRRDHGTLVTAGRRRDAQAVYLQELQPLLVGLESAIDRSVPDPLADMRSRLAGFERRSHIVSRLTRPWQHPPVCCFCCSAPPCCVRIGDV